MFTLPSQEYFCLRRIYSSEPGILLPEECSLFLARNTSARGGFTLSGKEYEVGLLFLARSTSA
jgi:hypothetical protein